MNKQLCLAVATLGAAVVMRDAGRCQSQELLADELVSRSSIVAVGKVTALKSAWSADRTRIVTNVTVAVDQYLKGEGTSTVMITVPGGEVDGIGELYSHTARFSNDEEVVIFAERDRQGQLRVVGGDQGKATVRKDETTGRRFVSESESLEMFTAKIMRAVRAQE